MSDPIRVAISGAAGRIGYALIFRIAAGGLFGRDRRVSLGLHDLPELRPLLEADEMELRDCAFPLLDEVRVGADPVRAFAGADWVILLASAPFTPEIRRRSDWIRANVPTYVDLGRAINQACPNARVLVVANPCNTNCLVAMNHAPDVPREHWFAMNRLDRMRATARIAQEAGVPVGEVNRVAIFGNHSETLYVDIHNAYIGETPVPEVLRDPNWQREVLEPFMASRSREIADLRGASPAGTAAQAILGTIRSITAPTPFGRRFGASVFVREPEYGVPPGLVFGMPLSTEDGKAWEIVRGLYLDEYAQNRIAENVAELQLEAAVAEEVLTTLHA
jgi:malate dehydrogenase